MKTTRILTLFTVFALALSAYAYDFQSGDLYYNITSNTSPYTVEVTYEVYYYHYDGNYSGLTTVAIPTEVSYGGQTYSVTSIGFSAFANTGLTSITIPSSVTSIEDDAFKGCSSLTSIIIPESVTSIADGAFEGTPWWSSKPDGLVYINNILYSYNGVMPANTSLTVADGTISISSNALNNCVGLTSLTIPESVTSIGSYAFANTGLTSITIPESVTSIGSSAFANTGLVSLVFNADSCADFSDKIWTFYDRPFGGLTTLQTVTIGENVKNIPAWFISGCNNVTSIIIPENITSIGHQAFAHTGLTSISIPEGITSIKVGTFRQCHSLTSVTLPEGVLSIEDEAFADCSDLISVTIPNSVTSIGKSAFTGCSGLTSVTTPSSVTSIEESAFDGCEQLTQLELPSIKTIAPYAFANCIRLSKAMFGQNLDQIGDSAFANCGKLIRITCYATIVPLGNENSFANYNGYLYVPCDLLVDYEADLLFGKFKYIQCIAAEPSTSTTEVTIVSGATDATFTWPVSDNTQSYTLEIRKDGEVFCTLRFNGNGQLLGISFAPSNGTETQNVGAALTALGYQFSVTGLNSASLYTYELKALDASNNELASYAGQFSTDGYVGIGNVEFIEGVYAQNGAIVIDNDTNLPVAIYDVVGRLVASGSSLTQYFEVPNAGVYIVKVGDQTMKVLVP